MSKKEKKAVKLLNEIVDKLKTYDCDIDLEIHYPGDEGFDYLNEGDVSIYIKNPYGANDMYIDLSDVFTFVYGHINVDYKTNESDFDYLLEDINKILQNNACLAEIYCGDEDEDNWLGSTILAKDEMYGEPDDIFAFIYSEKGLSDLMDQYGGVAIYRFWNPEDDTVRLCE